MTDLNPGAFFLRLSRMEITFESFKDNLNPETRYSLSSSMQLGVSALF